ncbi:alpha-dehydro-beta-deoxy-D-glucarate aldolase [Corynebacterium capitovis DSM 44611]|uniref:hypothetical protein n=1 Tax=Corynebacterium capitovis TaxID=131081 RepID=UPI0003642252|nr:alpha-dehydro-beta-deoxy-D-glucarate aldolase [Corynebacterium capitovis DSM 44611]
MEHTFRVACEAGKPVGVNAFNVDQARAYLEQGAAFALVGADVQLLATSARALAADFIPNNK